MGYGIQMGYNEECPPEENRRLRLPNKNYLRGRRFEYAIKKRWTNEEYTALRTAGSHGAFDIVAYKSRLNDYNGPEGGEIYLRPQSTREVRGHYEYLTFITPIIGYGIQCKVKKLRGKKHAR